MVIVHLHCVFHNYPLDSHKVGTANDSNCFKSRSCLPPHWFSLSALNRKCGSSTFTCARLAPPPLLSSPPLSSASLTPKQTNPHSLAVAGRSDKTTFPPVKWKEAVHPTQQTTSCQPTYPTHPQSDFVAHSPNTKNVLVWWMGKCLPRLRPHRPPYSVELPFFAD